MSAAWFFDSARRAWRARILTGRRCRSDGHNGRSRRGGGGAGLTPDERRTIPGENCSISRGHHPRLHGEAGGGVSRASECCHQCPACGVAISPVCHVWTTISRGRGRGVADALLHGPAPGAADGVPLDSPRRTTRAGSWPRKKSKATRRRGLRGVRARARVASVVRGDPRSPRTNQFAREFRQPFNIRRAFEEVGSIEDANTNFAVGSSGWSGCCAPIPDAGAGIAGWPGVERSQWGASLSGQARRSIPIFRRADYAIDDSPIAGCSRAGSRCGGGAAEGRNTGRVVR